MNSFIDIGAGLVLSMWFVLAILYLKKQFVIARLSNVMYDELFTRVKYFLTNRLHSKAAEHS